MEVALRSCSKFTRLGIAFAVAIAAFLMQMVFAPSVLHAVDRYALWPGDRKLKPVLPADGEAEGMQICSIEQGKGTPVDGNTLGAREASKSLL